MSFTITCDKCGEESKYQDHSKNENKKVFVLGDGDHDTPFSDVLEEFSIVCSMCQNNISFN